MRFQEGANPTLERDLLANPNPSPSPRPNRSPKPSPNQEGGEAGFEANEGLAGTIALLAPLKAKHPNISHADLWALAANVAVEELGGPAGSGGL